SGVEALVRWNHPTRGVVPPDRFITLAEETGLINELGSWVMEQACAQVHNWEEAHPDHKLRLGVNISTRQLRRPHIVDEIRAIVRLGHSLGVEIVAEGVETRQQVNILQPLGCRGQGYFYSRPVSPVDIEKLLDNDGRFDHHETAKDGKGAKGAKRGAAPVLAV